MHEKQDTAQSIDTAQHQTAPRRRRRRYAPLAFLSCVLATMGATWLLSSYVEQNPNPSRIGLLMFAYLLFGAGLASGANIFGKVSK